MAADFKILDEEYQMMHDTYLPKATSIEELMAEYFETISSIIGENILEGATAIALQNFASVAEAALKSRLEEILLKHNNYTKDFMDEIADKDDTVFT